MNYLETIGFFTIFALALVGLAGVVTYAIFGHRAIKYYYLHGRKHELDAERTLSGISEPVLR